MMYENMEELRKELDLLDNELIKLISKRFKFIEQAAIIKDDISKIRDNERIENIIGRFVFAILIFILANCNIVYGILGVLLYIVLNS